MECEINDSNINKINPLSAFKTIFLFLNTYNFEATAEIFKKELESISGNFLRNVPSTTVTLQPNKNLSTFSKHNLNPFKHPQESKLLCDSKALKIEESQVFYVPEDVIQRESVTQTVNSPRKEDKEVLTLRNSAEEKAEYVKLKSKFTELQSEHQKLIAVTTELTSALQLNIIGQTKSMHQVLDQCKSVYPQLFGAGQVEEPSTTNKPSPKNNHGVVTKNKPCIDNNNNNNSNNNKDNHEHDNHNEAELTSLNLDGVRHGNNETPITPDTVRKVINSVFERIFSNQDASKLAPNVAAIKRDQIEELVTSAITQVLESPKDKQSVADKPNNVTRLKENAHDAKYKVARLFDIDFKKIKIDLSTCGNEKILRILQALRWRITKSNSNERNRIMAAYIENDFLCLKTKTKSLPEYFLHESSQTYIQESMCRLLNTIASLKEGRDYLLHDDKLLRRALLPKIRDITNLPSPTTRNMMVATLQKLSIRKVPRTIMVGDGLLEILVAFLEEHHDKLPKYCLEYCSALVAEAKKRSAKMPRRVVRLIRKFLEGGYDFCLPYINGIMFSLFENDAVLWEAKNQNIEDVITTVQQKLDNDNLRTQLDFVMKYRLSNSNDNVPIDDNDEENQEEVDLLEMELDQDDYVTSLASGEDLLEDYQIASTTPVDSGKTVSKNQLQPSESVRKVRKGSMNSSRSLCDENVQYFQQKPEASGVFDKNKFRRLKSPQNVNRSFARAGNMCRIPSTTVCYMEPFTRFQETKDQSNRYTCSCYDAICKELAEDNMPITNNTINNNCGMVEERIEENRIESKIGCGTNIISDKEVKCNNITKDLDDTERLTSPSIVPVTRIKGKVCKMCGESTCDCAFESRPKLSRTPP